MPYFNFSDFLARKKGGDVRWAPKVRPGEGYFTPVPKGSTPHRSGDAWTEAPGKNRREKRANYRAARKERRHA